jgi:site-specific DNA-adenine methylase
MSKNKHNAFVGSSIERSDERIDETGEVFTPAELCAQMVSEIPESILKNKNSTFLDNSAGSGNFLLALQTELLKYHNLSHINDNMLYGVELMEDNHAELCKRLGVSVDHPHFVCANALEYDYGFGQLIGLENELGKIENRELYSPPTVDKKSQAPPIC